MTTIRAYKGAERLATAAVLKDTTLLQVFPSKISFASEEEWRTAWAQADRFDTTNRSAAPKKMTALSRYREKRLIEFFREEYEDMFQSLTLVRTEDGPLLSAVLAHDQSLWTVSHSGEFWKPPRITKNGELIQQYDSQYSPALTSVRWLMMLAFVKPDSKYQ